MPIKGEVIVPIKTTLDLNGNSMYIDYGYIATDYDKDESSDDYQKFGTITDSSNPKAGKIVLLNNSSFYNDGKLDTPNVFGSLYSDIIMDENAVADVNAFYATKSDNAAFATKDKTYSWTYGINDSATKSGWLLQTPKMKAQDLCDQINDISASGAVVDALDSSKVKLLKNLTVGENDFLGNIPSGVELVLNGNNISLSIDYFGIVKGKITGTGNIYLTKYAELAVDEKGVIDIVGGITGALDAGID
ncbi:MAG: hypothetical protein ACRCUS_08090, partial [Anaerovoracaceae bacterium]